MSKPILKNTMQSRQGETAGRMRIVLGLSILFIVVAFGALYGFEAIFAAHQ